MLSGARVLPEPMLTQISDDVMHMIQHSIVGHSVLIT